MVASRIAIAAFLLFAGVGLFFIPILGWVLGPVVIFGAFHELLKSPKASWRGACPYCQTTHVVEEGVAVRQCPACKNRFTSRDGKFAKLESSTVDSDEVQCPFCAEAIKRAAKKCKHCGSDLTA